MEDESQTIGITNNKEQFVSAEYSLLKQWGRILNKEQDGTGWLYLVIQTFRNKDSGTAWPSISTLADLCGYGISKTVRILRVLEKHGLIIRIQSKKHQSNHYEIPDLPESPELDEEIEFEESTKPKKVFNEMSLDEATKNGTAILEKKHANYVKKILTLKPIEKWKCTDMMKFFSAYYKQILKTPYPRATVEARDRANWKQMINTYGPENVLEAVKFGIENWRDLDYVKGWPDYRNFYKHRVEILKDSQDGKTVKQQYDYDEDEVGIGKRKRKLIKN